MRKPSVIWGVEWASNGAEQFATFTRESAARLCLRRVHETGVAADLLRGETKWGIVATFEPVEVNR